MPRENMQALEAALNAPEETAEETASAATDAPSSQEAPASNDTNKGDDTIDGASAENLLRALDSIPSILKPKTDADATEQSTGGQVAPAETAAPAAADEDDDDKDEQVPAAGETATTTARNFRLHTKDAKLATFIKTLKSAQVSNPSVNPAEVAALVGYDTPGRAQAPAAPAVASPTEPPPPDPRVTAIQAEITALEADLARAKEAYEPTDELVRKLSRKDRELERAQEEVEAQALADREYDSAFAEARAEVSKLAPEADQADTDQYDAIIAEMARIRRSDPGLLDQPNYPLLVLQRAAARKPALFPNVVRKAAPAAAPAALTPAPKPAVKPGQPASRPVGVVVPGVGQGPTIDASNAKAAMGELSTEDLIRLADQASALERKRKA